MSEYDRLVDIIRRILEKTEDLYYDEHRNHQDYVDTVSSINSIAANVLGEEPLDWDARD